uniref:ATP-binding cassette sub-family D n=1 Tax=Nephromyces sp. MMRI TaxID=2496275 RepID=A0A3Q8UCE6_9APIC|nr:ATP-binding cassette sub-family D [Nephromyces sp. MMRI]
MKSSFSQLSLLMTKDNNNIKSLSDLTLFSTNISNNANESTSLSSETSNENNVTSSSHKRKFPNELFPKGLNNFYEKESLAYSFVNPFSIINNLINKLFKGDINFLKKAALLSRIAIPSLFCQESLTLILLLLSLAIRTFLSIWIASIHGSVVKTIVELDFPSFCRCILILLCYSLPASFINSSIQYLNSTLTMLFRRRLTYHFLLRYLHNMIFYHVTSLDKRIEHPDQRLTDDINKWSRSLASLFSNLAKPILDIIFLSKRLSHSMGISGPLIIIAWYSFTALITSFIAPKFGKYMTQTQELEGEYRSIHSSLIGHSEEIAFYRGNYFELRKLVHAFDNLWKHSKKILLKKLFMGCFDSLLVKHGAVIVGYFVVILPVFGLMGQKANQKKFEY